MSSHAEEKARPVPSIEALRTQLAQHQRGAQRLRQPVAIIGPGDGDAEVCAAARRVAGELARAGLQIVCGGRGGVMAAASQGAAEAGGVAIGILPEEDLRAANPYVTVGIATGMGEMRNAVIARSAVCLIAIGGGMGTVSEMALGLKWNKRVFTWRPELALPGATDCDSVDALLHVVLAWLLAQAQAAVTA
ncbi:MAG: hypothetical protein GAK30_03282 [Paracidovorax wautersii]|uniref:TIGR00725 family protein n=1 Tax=Paracidovorax wautersii TaxID=1177982 RepID=A0A7V8FLE6_9BURK|nr:MAG: hypothetical protein GAK30_03282 [Paracidovorax wautersii]